MIRSSSDSRGARVRKTVNLVFDLLILVPLQLALAIVGVIVGIALLLVIYPFSKAAAEEVPRLIIRANDWANLARMQFTGDEHGIAIYRARRMMARSQQFLSDLAKGSDHEPPAIP